MDPKEAKKELDYFLRVHRDIKNSAVNLLSRVKKIKENCKKKKFAEALTVLESRFWTYRYLRNLISEYKKLDQGHKKLSLGWGAFNQHDQHRYLWWDEQMVELSKDEEKMKLFGLDVLKELSLGQSIERHLDALKKNYNPKEEAELNSALDKIKEELINLNNFAQEGITVLETEEAIIQMRVQKIEAQSRFIIEKVRSVMEKEIDEKCRLYDSHCPPNEHGDGNIKLSSEIRGKMISPSYLLYQVMIIFNAMPPALSGTFSVGASHLEPGTYEVSITHFSGEQKPKERVSDAAKVEEMMNLFLKEFRKALEERRQEAWKKFGSKRK